jgi:glucose/arabinose dehydrogenase
LYDPSVRAVVPGVILLGFAVLGAVASCGDDEGTPDPEPDASTGGPDATSGDATPNQDGALTDGGIDARPPLVNTCVADAGPYPDTWLADPRLCLTVFASELPLARQLAFAPNGDLFVQAAGKVMALFDQNKDGVADESERAAFASSVEDRAEINHGLAFSPDSKWVYASNDSTIFRWPYKLGDHVSAGPVEIVMSNMPPGSGHISRTLVFDAQGRLYVNVGSSGDVDQTPDELALRSQVRRFTIPNVIPAGGLDYVAGELFAWGLRNEVGLAFDSKGRMWGVENGSDGVYLPQFGNITDDNPGEEINRLDGPGTRFFGYGFCWSEFAIDGGLGAGTQWAYWGYPLAQTDAWCRNPINVRQPAGSMQGHWASLGIGEYTGNSLPWQGDLFVGAHGSSFRVPPVGRLVARAHLVGDKVQAITPIVGHGVDGGLEQGTWDVRPVDIRTGPDGALYFSDDWGHRVFRLGYKP